MNSIPGHELSKSEIQVVRLQALVIGQGQVSGCGDRFCESQHILSSFCLCMLLKDRGVAEVFFHLD